MVLLIVPESELCKTRQRFRSKLHFFFLIELKNYKYKTGFSDIIAFRIRNFKPSAFKQVAAF